MGLQTSRTESKSRVLINSQRSVSVARIVTEKDPILSAEYVVWVIELELSFSPTLRITVKFSKTRYSDQG
jgi:hypothetical protein